MAAKRLRRWQLRDLLVVVCGVVAVALIVHGTLTPLVPVDSAETRVVTVRRGSDVGKIAHTLHQAGVIRSPAVFTLLARTLGMDRTLRAGQYELSAGMSALSILRALQKGSDFHVVIPEGLTIPEMADTLEKAIGLPRAEFIAATRDSALRRRVSDPAPTLEGYLFPDTYDILADMSAREIVAQMVGRFESVYQMAFENERPPAGLSRHEVLTLASIVEAESRVPAERPRVAAVYLNRLRVGMRLQADPTVAYALGGRRDRIYYKDLEVKSSYNTYRHRGLPPGPIASPGKAAIEAVMHPQRGCQDLYFVATGTGSHIFSQTLEQHHAATVSVRSAGGSTRTERGLAAPAPGENRP
jgi:UPF0755 protein